MYVNVNDIKAEVDNFNALLDEYEENYLNLYNEISKASFYWQDVKSLAFFENIKHERMQVVNNYNQLTDYKNIYVYIYDKYQELGNKIKFDLEMKDNIMNSINNCNNKLKTIIRKYFNLDLSFCPFESEILKREIRKVESMQSNLLEIKSNIKDIYQRIENIEAEVARKFNLLNVDYIKENDISRFL